MRVVRQAFRTLFKTPFLTIVAVVSLALGIGANAAMYSVFDQFLVRSLPVQEPDRLVNLGNTGPHYGSTSCTMAGDCNDIYSYPLFRELQEAPTGLSGIAGHRDMAANLSVADRTLDGSGLLVSGSYFEVLGVQPALGRLLSPSDDVQEGGHPVAVLSHGFWERELGLDRGVLNQTVTVNGQPMTVVGVAPRGFRGTTLGSDPDVFVPISMRHALDPACNAFENRRAYWIYVFGRLEPGVSLAQAEERINAWYVNVIQEVEAPLQEGASAAGMERFLAKRVTVEEGNRGQSIFHADARSPLLLLLSITALVLLIACANVANLLLARGAQRQTEMAVRNSLGANRRQLVTQLLTESVLLAAMGGAASLLVAQWTLRGLASLMPADLSSGLPMEMDGVTLIFTALVALGTGILFGLFPALNSTRRDLVTVIKGNAGQPSGSRAARRFRSGLATAQVALSMTLLVVAGLFLKSLVNVSRIDLGMETSQLVTFRVAPERNGHDYETSAAFFDRLGDELRAVPGVTQVTASLVPILSGSNWGTDVAVQGFDNENPDVDRNSRLNVIDAEYFSTMGVPLLAGREITEADTEGAEKVAVVNEAFARHFNLDPRSTVGTMMSADGPGAELDTRIVGLVQDAAYSDAKRDAPPIFFRPWRQSENMGTLSFYVRTAGDPAPVLRAIPETVRRLDANLPVQGLRRMEEQVDQSLYVDRLITTMAAAFAILATVLAAIGLYGVLAYTVAQRTREIGLRMALGAERGGIQGLVLGQVSRMLAVGGFIGIAAAVLLGRLAESLLFGVEGMDVGVLAAAVISLALVAYGAGFVPARRASRVDPMNALRYD